MSLTDFEVGGYDLLSGMDAESNGGNAPTSNAAAPRFGRRAAPNALDHEALSKDASKRTSTANMPSVNASQDRRDSSAGRRGPKRSLDVIGTDSVKNIDEFSHSVHSSTADVRLPRIHTNQSRENTANGVAATGRLGLGEGGNASGAGTLPATRHSMSSPTVNTQVRRGLFDANKAPTAMTTAAQHHPTRPQSNIEKGTAEPTETFLSDRVSVEKSSFTGTRAGWVREQARRLEEQVAAAQALANSPHSLSSIRQRSANTSWRQKMETSMNSISVEKRDVELVRREAPIPLAGTAAVAPTLASPTAPRTSSAPVPTTTATSAVPARTRPAAASSVAAPPPHNAQRRDLAPIKAASPAPSVTTTGTSLSNPKTLRRDASPGATSNASQLNHSGVPDSILSAEYGHALGTTDWNHEYDINDITDLFPPAQSMQGKFAIASSSDTQKAKQQKAAAAKVPARTGPINGTTRPSAPTSRPTRQQPVVPTKLPGKTVSPSAPSSDSTRDGQSPAGITPTNASNASRIAAAASQRSNTSAADKASAHTIIPAHTTTLAAAATKGSKAADGSLYTEEQRAKLEAWQSIPILSYRPAEAERYATACARYFPAQDETADTNLFTFPAPGRAPPEMAGEAVELNYEIHNVLTLMRHRHRKPMWTYPAVLPTDFVAQTRQRRPRTPRSFYGPEKPEQGNDWFRKALDDATRVPSPDLTEIEAREAEEKKANPKALKGVDPEVAAAHRKQQEMEDVNDINKAAVLIEA